jgi:predicted nucleic acid-binding protein
VILVDSSVWIDYFRGIVTSQTRLLDGLLGDEPVLMGDLILAEVLQGFRRDLDFHRAEKHLSALPIIELGGRDIALQAARNFRRLRAKGVTVRGTVDGIIATRCIQDDLLLLDSDGDFGPFEKHLGLRRLA